MPAPVGAPDIHWGGHGASHGRASILVNESPDDGYWPVGEAPWECQPGAARLTPAKRTLSAEKLPFIRKKRAISTATPCFAGLARKGAGLARDQGLCPPKLPHEQRFAQRALHRGEVCREQQFERASGRLGAGKCVFAAIAR